MNLSLWGIRNPLPATLVFVVLCVAGLWGFRQLPISQLPDLEFPSVSVTVTLPGATPTQLETDVTRRVEDAVASIAGIDKLNSTVSEGSSVTTIEFEIGRDMDGALDEVRDAIDRVRQDLPPEIEEPQVVRQTLVGGQLLAYAVQSDRLAEDELSWFIDDTVTKALYGVPGVGQVARSGGLDREVRIALRPQALQAYGITANAVSTQLARLQVERPGGRTMRGGSEQSVRTVATVRSAADLADYPISLPDGRQVRLSAIAEVTDAYADRRELALLDGRTAVGVSVRRTRGSSDVGVGKAVRAEIDKLRAAYPYVKFTEVGSTVENAEASYRSSINMLWEGAILAVIVVWWFLREWRATWISAIALPLSLIPTFGLMHWFGFSLNLLTLLALAVVVGVLVDDAIVEVENIARHRAMGKSPRQAAIDAADEIGVAVVATSATLAAVFVPVAFMPGITGKFFREFGWTAAAAVLFSLLVARLLTPMMASRLMRGEPRSHVDSPLMQRYIGWVDTALRHRRRTLLAALVIFVLSLGLVPFIPATFLPQGDPSRTQLEVELPPGTRIEETRDVAEQVRALLRPIPEIEAVFTRIGGASGGGHGAGGGAADARRASLTLELFQDRKRNLQEIEQEIRERLRDLPGVRTSFSATGMGGRLDLKIAGKDPEALVAASRNIESAIRGLPGIGSVTSSASLLRPEVVIEPDPARAADLGVSTTDIAEAARVATSGDFRQRLAKLNLAERQIPIRVQVADESLSDAGLLSLMRVPGRNGPVPLSAVAAIRESSGPAEIDRFDRERTVKIVAELNGRPLGDVMGEVRRLAAVKQLPPGVRVLTGGDAEAFVDLFIGFAVAMIAGVVCVYTVLVLLFHSLTQPLTILAAVPLAGAGAFGMLLLTGYELSMPALVGLLALTGIATKNSILIVDYAVLGEREHGLSRHEALLDACRKRARPVIMTTIAMGAGMLPISLGLGADGNFRAPLGLSVLGGLITSTLLSLIVVPAAYSVVADRTDKWNRRRAERRARRHPEQAAGTAGTDGVPKAAG